MAIWKMFKLPGCDLPSFESRESWRNGSLSFHSLAPCTADPVSINSFGESNCKERKGVILSQTDEFLILSSTLE